MLRKISSQTLPNVLFSFFSLAAIALGICILVGCKGPSESQFQLYSMNATNITQVIGKNCSSCSFLNVPERYMFGMSGTCRSRNGTTRCQRAFPNTFNLTEVTLADVVGSNSSNTSSTYTEQYSQFTSTVTIDHALDYQLSKAIDGILIASVVLNFCFIPLRFIIDRTRGRSLTARIFLFFEFLDWAMLCAAVGMVYAIIRSEISGAYSATPEIRSKKWQVKFETGFWLLVGAAACRPIYVVLSSFLSRVLVSKLAATIKVLRHAVETFPDQDIIDNGCKRLLEQVTSDRALADLLSHHFNGYSANLLLGMPDFSTGSPPGILLWEDCPSCQTRTPKRASKASRRGVYLIVLSECGHGNDRTGSTSKHMYVGSGRSAGGVMLRVREHTDPEYRRRSPQSRLYTTWESFSKPCVGIYLLAEWDAIADDTRPGYAESFDAILLAEAICQVDLRTFGPGVWGNMPEFTQYLAQYVPVTTDTWGGCNVNSALQASRWDGNTRR